MCGIAGLVDPSGLATGWYGDARALETAIRHRGPDDHGLATDLSRGEVPARFDEPHELATTTPRIAFVHRRLSILDLSPAARQPMIRDRVVLTYNGEIYNYRELRSELEREGHVFRTSSDTEVLLCAYRQWGISVVRRLRGIFAFAIADLTHGKVYLARDHLGVKPLYYAQAGSRLAFSSELKGLLRLDWLPPRLDEGAIALYLQFLWIPGPRTGVAGIKKLAPGSWLELDLATSATRSEVYWSPLEVAREPTNLADGAAVEQLRAEVGRIVREQLVADVPLGAFLSGGLDSSLIVAEMARSTGTAPSTFTVGYRADDLAYDIVPDDLPYARQVSELFGTRNTELLLHPDVAALLPSVVEALDEPLGDPAAISSYLICQAAKPKLTVMLSGMGADEIFGGYPRQRALVYGGVYRRAPAFIRRAFRGSVQRLPGAGRTAFARLGRSAQKFVAAADARPLHHYVGMETYFDQLHARRLIAHSGALDRADELVADEITELTDRIEATARDPVRQSVLWDLLTYLPNLNLAYTDRTSMAHGVEVRVPFLDVKLVEWSLSLPTRQLIRVRRGSLAQKWILKQAAATRLPDTIIWRKKAGFGSPVRSWLRGDLVELREDLLGPSGLGSRGWFEASELRRLQDEFTAGKSDYALHLWMLMSLELWARRFLRSARPT